MLYKPYLTSILLLLRPMPLLLSIELSNSGLKKRTPKELHYTLTDNPLAKSDGFSLGWAQSSCKKSSGRARDIVFSLAHHWSLGKARNKKLYPSPAQKKPSTVPCLRLSHLFFFLWKSSIVAQWSRALETSCPSERRTGNPTQVSEGKGCSDESSVRTYGDGAHGLRIPKERSLAPSHCQREDSLALLLLDKKS